MLRTRARAGSMVVNAMLLTGAAIVAVRPSIDSMYTLGAVAGFSLLDIVGVLLVALIVPLAMVGLTEVPRLKVLLLPAAFIAVSMVWSIVVTVWIPALGLVPMLFRLLGMLAAFLAFASLSARRPRAVITVFVLASIAPVLFAVKQIFSGVPLAGQVNQYVRESVSRLTGTFVHPSELGKFCGLMLMFAFAGFLLERRPSRRFWWAVMAGANGFIMILTYTRVVWIAVPIAILAVATLTRKPIVPIVMIGGAVAVAARASGVQQRLSGFSSLDVRQRLWDQLLPQVAGGDALFGYGLGRVNAMVSFASLQAGIPILSQAHNDYIRVMLETGVVGLILYAGSLIGVLWVAWRSYRLPTLSRLGAHLTLATVGCTIVVMITSITDNLFQRSALMWTFWALIGATMYQIWIARKAMQQQPAIEGAASVRTENAPAPGELVGAGH